jgi:DNA recombination protein RmuC
VRRRYCSGARQACGFRFWNWGMKREWEMHFLSGSPGFLETAALAALALIIILLGFSVICLVILLRGKRGVDFAALIARLDLLDKGLDRCERSSRDEIARNREESTLVARQGREETANALKSYGDSLQANMTNIAGLQKDQLETFAGQLSMLTQTNEKRLDMMRETIEQRLQAVHQESARQLSALRDDSSANSKTLREEVSNSLKNFNDSVLRVMSEVANLQKNQLDIFSERLARLTETNEQKLGEARETLEQRLTLLQSENSKKLDQLREESNSGSRILKEEVAAALKNFNDSVIKGMSEMATLQKEQFEAFTVRLGRLTESNENRLDALRNAIDGKLKQIQEDNAKQLEQMRATVDEKLQGTLEKRLGESFKQVSERLEQVHKGLGEMQVLATGVGDLKRVLTNVKTRGIWGEIQLETLLEQILTPDQFERNVKTKENSAESVEFAVKLPGRGEQDGREVVWLPIDAKFPIEDYQRLVDAQEISDLAASEQAGKMLSATIKNCAKTICEKYLNPPATTDFGIMFLPTEGLYAEVIRRTWLVESLQRECRVIVAGPTTLAALLNSLQMGFRTLAIQKRSSEVWKLLGAVKTEFGKFGTTLDGVKKKLDQAANTMDDAAKRSRSIERKLRNVQELPSEEAHVMLAENDSEGEPEEIN